MSTTPLHHTVWPWTVAGLALGLLLALALAMVASLNAGEHAEAAVQLAAACTLPVSWLIWQLAPVTQANWLMPIGGAVVVYFAIVGTAIGLLGARARWPRGTITAALAFGCLVLPILSYSLLLLLA